MKASVKISGEKLGDQTARVKYKLDDGKKVDVTFQWHTKQIGSGGYFSQDDFYLTTDVSVQKALISKKIYSDSRKVGEDIWISRQAGGGSKESGPQNFEECLKDEKLFEGVEDKQLQTVLRQAQKDTLAAMPEFYENYQENDNKGTLAKVRDFMAKKFSR